MDISLSPSITPKTLKAAAPKAPTAPAEKSEEAAPQQGQKDSVSLGYKVARGAVSTVGGTIGGVIGSVKGSVVEAGSGEHKARPLFHKIARYTGAAAGVALAGLAVAGGGGIAAVGTLLLAPIAGAALGGAVVSGLEAGSDSASGALKGLKDGAQLGWQIAGGAVDKVAGWFAPKEAPPEGETKPHPPTDNGSAPPKEAPPEQGPSKDTPPTQS